MLFFSYLGMQLFEKVFIFHLTRETAAATTADFDIRASFHEGSFRLEFSGYNEKLLLVIDTAMKTLKQTLEVLDEKLFKMLKTDTLKNLKNMLLFPHCLQEIVVSRLMQTNAWDISEYEREISRITIDDSQKIAKRFFSDAKIQVLLQGNVESTKCNAVVVLLKEYLMTDPFLVSHTNYSKK